MLSLWTHTTGASAQSTPTTDENGRTAECSLEQLAAETAMTVTGATITRRGEAARRLDARQAYAFLQTWLPYSIFGGAPQEVPGPEVPRWTVVVDTPGANQLGNLTVFVASDGTDVWVGSRNNTPPPPEKGIKVFDADKTLASMDGRIEPTCNAPGPDTSVASTTTPSPTTVDGPGGDDEGAAAGGDGGTSAMTVGLVGVGSALAGALIVLVLRRRS
jgi:hypothetical protein